MIINYSNTKYRITYDGFSFVENALGNPNLVQIAIASGTTIQLAPDEFFGIDYRKNGEYASWRLSAINTRLVRAEKHYIYARLSRTDDQALIVFSVNHYRMDGLILNAGQTPTAETPSAEEQPLQDGPYYYVEIGSITATNSVDQPTTLREIKIDGGYLTTPQGSGSVEQMFRIIAGNLIQPLKRMASHTVEGTLEILGGLKSRGKVKLNGKEFDDILREQDKEPGATLPPEEVKQVEDKSLISLSYLKKSIRELDEKFLSKLYPDTAQGLITFLQGVQIGNYSEGFTGSGGKIDDKANAELESLKLRRFLEVPELRYNRISIQVGNKWNAPGGGIIEKCVPDVDENGNLLNTGTIYLHLEDGEIGTIEVDDICQGIFHSMNSTENSSEDSDDSKGNFHFAGFYTTYFRITEILDNVSKSKFRYALRGTSATWTSAYHPTDAMHFVGYGNFDTVHHPERQTSRYSTRTYERFLQHVDDWEIRADNIAAQFGDLSNLNIHGLYMEGYSAYLNNIYMSGVIEQFEHLPLRMHIETEGDQTLAYGEHLHVICKVFKGWEDKTAQVKRWQITRDSGYSADDAAWALRPKVKNFSGVIDIHLDQDASIDDLGKSDISCLFTINAFLDGEREPLTKQLIV